MRFLKVLAIPSLILMATSLPARADSFSLHQWAVNIDGNIVIQGACSARIPGWGRRGRFRPGHRSRCSPHRGQLRRGTLRTGVF